MRKTVCSASSSCAPTIARCARVSPGRSRAPSAATRDQGVVGLGVVVGGLVVGAEVEVDGAGAPALSLCVGAGA